MDTHRITFVTIFHTDPRCANSEVAAMIALIANNAL